MTPKARLNALIELAPKWLILDGAGCPEVLWFARGAGLACRTLFNHNDAPLAEQGPWLIELAQNADVMALTLAKDPYGHSALWCGHIGGATKLQHALTHRLYAQKPDGSITRFRFYDTRVLHHYLMDEEPELVQQFLAPFTALWYAPLSPFQLNRAWHGWIPQDDGRVCHQLIPIEET